MSRRFAAQHPRGAWYCRLRELPAPDLVPVPTIWDVTVKKGRASINYRDDRFVDLETTSKPYLAVCIKEGENADGSRTSRGMLCVFEVVNDFDTPMHFNERGFRVRTVILKARYPIDKID